ncbi:hypothetical protein ACJX0J_009779, partial [Zea mays]
IVVSLRVQGVRFQDHLGFEDFGCNLQLSKGWPGSVHDTRVLQDTLITYADRFPHPPE